ncbi:FAD-dependent oxidoreductase [Kineococcus gynurae]|uniref:FAD-dependent oxidoreductase n=1 Tax=Kineococcus gynurae TaxID=452979 RepID=A0ABV5LQQ6_9ACTN
MSAAAPEATPARTAARRPVVVIGAGPAGLAAAEHLLDHGQQVVVLDGAPVVGGLSRSIPLWGDHFDLGPHSFYSSAHPESVRRWLDLAQGRVDRTVARRKAVWRGRVVDLPPSPGEVLAVAGPVAAGRFATSRVRARAANRLGLAPAPGSAYDALTARHGRAVVEELFVPYCRKYLGVHPVDLSVGFAERLLGTRTSFSGPVELLMPRGGTGSVWEELARRLRARGAEILLSTPVTGLVADAEVGRVEAVTARTSSGGTVSDLRIDCRAVVASVPPPLLLRWLPGTTVPAGTGAVPLRSRDTILVHLRTSGPVGQDAHYVTAYDEGVRTGRLTNTRVWRPEAFRDRPDTVLCAEFWSSGDDDLADLDDAGLTRLAVAELAAFGVDRRVVVEDADVLRLPRSVPVLGRGVEAVRAALDAQLDRFTNLARIGRHGTHSWDGQEDSLLTGRSIGAHVLEVAP